MRELLPGPRILLGPGPSMADPRVLRAMSTPLLGQFDPEFTAIMNDVTELTRFAFETGNERAFPVSGAGRAALEAAITSIVEPGDRVVVGECGRFGLLLIEIAERCGAVVSAVRGSWGSVLEPDPIAAELRRAPTKLVAVVHGETSTGVLQPLDAIARVAHEHGRLLDPGALQSPHRADRDGVRPSRGAAGVPGRGPGRALRPSSRARRRAPRGTSRARSRPLRQGAAGATARVPHAGRGARRRRRAPRAPSADRGLRNRDRSGVRSARGSNLADRYDGIFRIAAQRAPLPRRARARATRRGLPISAGRGRGCGAGALSERRRLAGKRRRQPVRRWHRPRLTRVSSE